MAKQVQKALLSDIVSNYKNLKISQKYAPASNIGGDIYDVVEIKEDMIGLFIADVSVHGVAAALIMAVLKNIYRNIYMSYEDPKKLLTEMNKEFIKIFNNEPLGMFATAFYIILNL